MINTPTSIRLGALILTLCVLFVSACSVSSPIDAKVPGSRSLTADEYVERYAGNSIRFARGNGGPIDREMYFGEDGSFQTVDLDRDVILDGTWAINTSLGSSHLVISLTSGGFSDGEAYRTGTWHMTMYVNVLPDGTASVFSRSPEGPATVTQPKPAPGFQARARFNRINRKVSNALGS